MIGTTIKSLYKNVLKYNKRNCFNLLKKYINDDYNGKVCILYGLRRTGKKTMIFQMISELPIQKLHI